LGSDPLVVIGVLSPAAAWWDYVARNWALVSMLATVTFLVITAWLILRKYVNIMLNIIRDTPPPLAMGPRDFERIDGERVTFRAFDNLNLCGMHLSGDHEGRPRGMILFAHEFSSDMYSCARYCRPLLRAGFDVFSFDFRGHGESSGEPGYQPRQWPTDREVNDMLGAIAYVEDWLEQQGRPVEVGLFGISRGAGAAIMAAQNIPAVRAIVTDGAFSSDTTLEHLMKRWAYIFAKVRFVYENHPPQFWRFLRWLLFRACRRRLNCTFPSTRKALRQMVGPRPILFIHGERDSYIPVEQSHLLCEAAPGPKSLWVVPGAKHNQSVIVRPEYYAARTVAFFEEHLARSVVEPQADRGRPREAQTGGQQVGAKGRGRGGEAETLVREPARPTRTGSENLAAGTTSTGHSPEPTRSTRPPV
jgi:pimeloyl-ACP methyl ester carboxylesterase